jgi:hypothetical protein
MKYLYMTASTFHYQEWEWKCPVFWTRACSHSTETGGQLSENGNEPNKIVVWARTRMWYINEPNKIVVWARTRMWYINEPNKIVVWARTRMWYINEPNKIVSAWTIGHECGISVSPVKSLCWLGQ